MDAGRSTAPERQTTTDPVDIEDAENEYFDYFKRSQWLRAAVLGANDGILSTASLMMGVGAVRRDIKTMMLAGFSGLVAGACSMAIGEFVSVHSQLDIQLAQLQRDRKRTGVPQDTTSLPSPAQAAMASAVSFSLGATVPLLAACFIKQYKVRVAAVVTAVTVALALFGWVGAALGRAPPLRSAVRVLVGGWLSMGITFGLTKLVVSTSF